MYIITYAYELENLKGYEIKIEPPEEMAEFFRWGGAYTQSPLSYRRQASEA